MPHWINNFWEKKATTLDSTLMRAPLIFENGKWLTSDHLFIEQIQI